MENNVIYLYIVFVKKASNIPQNGDAWKTVYDNEFSLMFLEMCSPISDMERKQRAGDEAELEGRTEGS